MPYIHEDKCTGCGTCIAQCSGMAIFVLDKTYSEDKGTVSFPYEYLPMPKAGDKVKGVNRAGEVVCDAEVVKVLNPKSLDRTPVVTIAVPKDQVEEVRSIKRRAADTNFVLKQIEDGTAEDDILVCRCEEVTLGEIKKAIADGARTVTGVKLRTRAGMGLCQGRTCGKMVQAILRQQLGNTSEEISFSTNRPPVRPTTFGSIAGGDDNE